MSELKVYVKSLKTNIFGQTIVGQSYYLKSEADKVIAEKDAEIAELKNKMLQYKVLYKEKCRDINTQERFFAEKSAHHKYKRCLDKAKWCYDRWIRAYNSSRLQKARFYAQWRKRWLELAEKFKEAK